MSIREKILPILATFYGLGLVVLYHHFNNAPEKWDSASHINLMLYYSQALQDLELTKILTLSGYYPPFVHLFTAIVYFFYSHRLVPFVVSLFFYLLGNLFLFKWVKEVSKSGLIAMISVTIYALLPQVLIEARMFELDLPLTALLILSLYYLCKSEAFTRKRSTFMFAFMFSLAMLTKWYAFVFLVFPMGYVFILQVQAKSLKMAANTVLKNLFYVLIPFIPALLWYTFNLSSILAFFSTVSSQGELSDPIRTISVENILEYVYLINSFQLSFIVLLVLIASLLALVLVKSTHFWYLLGSILFPFTVFTLLSNKDVRYVMPLLPFFVFCIGLFVFHLLKYKKAVGILAFSLLVFYLSFTGLFLLMNQNQKLNKDMYWYGRLFQGPLPKYRWIYGAPATYAYDNQDWHVKQLYSYIRDLEELEGSDWTRIIFAVDYHYFHFLEFETYQLYEGTEYEVLASYMLTDDQLINDVIRNPNKHGYEYIVTAYNPGPSDLRHYTNMVKINRFLQTDTQYYVSYKKFTLPNGEDVYLFRLKK